MVVLLWLLLVGIWAYTIAHVVQTPEHAYRTGNQLVWLLVVILVPFIGVPLFWAMAAPRR